MAGIIRGSTKVAVDIDEAEMQKRLRESRAKKAEKSAGKRPRDDDEGRVADVLGKRKAIEEAHQHVMGSGPRLPPFDLQAPPKLPFGMEDVFAEGVEKVDFGRLRQQKEVNLAMHRQEVPLVNVFLEGVKSDPEALAKTPASSFVDRAQKTILTSAYAFGEMYVSMAKADKEIQRLKRRDQQAKSKVAEAEEAIREKNALLAQKAALAKEVAARTKEVEELKRSKAEEVAAARAEAIESYRSSEELKSYIMDRLVDEQLRWEDRLVRFNPSLDINFDTSGEPPAQTPPADASTPTPEAEPATEDAPSTES
ncbi:myosin-7B-like [Prunus dulcis]|uniref:myosin-7B-like n=1 Tax=Prunus dulcis TaxID=3755 RepID=UPI001483C042|nr:myosin-7B-like [Prunus dulcis]XP_034218994.1 myosin-7B-like [Prunus dulcis]